MKTQTIITKAETLIEILNSKGFKGFVDSTSRNDLTESIYNEELELQIFLPNSENDDLENEEWNKFSINENERFIQDLDLLIGKWNPILNFLNSINCEWE
jgi:hypothetical protein